VRRHTSGADFRATIPREVAGFQNRFTGGLELQRQADARQNFTNCIDLVTPIATATATCAVGAAQGSTTLDQRELVTSAGVYAGDEVNLSPRYIFTASARADAVRFAVQDHLITATNPDDSGNRTLRSVSPMAGFTIRLSPVSSYYANVSTAFETPTATELGNHPDGSAGINQDLLPQKSLTYESGLKGVAASGLQYNFALFSTHVRDELVPFEIPGSSGRRYFRNAGQTSRRGAELSAALTRGPLDFGLAYTYGDFRYRTYSLSGVNYAGNRIPGVPSHALQASVTARVAGISMVGEEVLSDRVFVDDANSLAAPGYGTTNLRFIADEFIPKSGISLMAGVYNLFDRSYAGSVSVNATGGKFFEPAHLRSAYAGFNLSFAQKRAK
jgi:iron complex outermembrane receptor protein